MTLNILNLSLFSSYLNYLVYLPSVGVPSPSSKGTSPKLKSRMKPKMIKICWTTSSDWERELPEDPPGTVKLNNGTWKYLAGCKTLLQHNPVTPPWMPEMCWGYWWGRKISFSKCPRGEKRRGLTDDCLCEMWDVIELQAAQLIRWNQIWENLRCVLGTNELLVTRHHCSHYQPSSSPLKVIHFLFLSLYFK